MRSEGAIAVQQKRTFSFAVWHDRCGGDSESLPMKPFRLFPIASILGEGFAWACILQCSNQIDPFSLCTDTEGLGVAEG